jgi:c-di-GMP-binding flagellar brake protein YcgR
MDISQIQVSVYPLQIYQMSDFWKDKGNSGREAIIFVIGVAVAVSILIIINVIKNKYNIPALTGADPQSSSSAPSRRFSGFVLRRLAKNMGLNRKQRKMLDFVLRTDNVTDPQLALNTPSMLDQHFKRAYRAIETTAMSDNNLQERLSMLFTVRNYIEANIGGANISSTRQLPNNISAMIDSGGEQYPVRVLSAKGECMMVENPKKAHGSVIRLAKGSKVTLSFFGETNSGFSVESRILDVNETKEGPVLKLVHSSQIKRLSHRRFRRRQAVIASNLYAVYVEGKRMVVDKKRFSGNILDISTGGCSITTNTPVNSGTRLKIEGSLGKMSIAALGQVLRINRSRTAAVMHIKFLKLPRKSMNMINAYVYEYAD